MVTALLDLLGKGKRNPVKKWWFDLEVVDGVCVEPVKGISQRDLNLDRKVDPAKQKMAYYPASMMPVPNDLRPQPVDRKEAMAEAERLETPEEAAVRRAGGGPAPPQYTATAPDPAGPVGEDFKPAIYGGGIGKASAERK